MAKGTLYAPAKINIGLTVGKKREDGFHPLDSYFVRIGLCDEISYSLELSDSLSVSISGNEGYLREEGMDLMEKAARAFSSYTGILFKLCIDIKKVIPTEAGLGGGSSDAATVLLILRKELSPELAMDEFIALGASVGSDIPFFLTEYPVARVKGRGEILKKASETEEVRYALLIFPEDKVSTKGAYRKLDSINYPFVTLPDTLSDITKERFPNDFERIVDEDYKNSIIEKAGGRYVSLSGSGSTWFILCRDKDEAEALSEEFAKSKVCSLFRYNKQ